MTHTKDEAKKETNAGEFTMNKDAACALAKKSKAERAQLRIKQITEHIKDRAEKGLVRTDEIWFNGDKESDLQALKHFEDSGFIWQIFQGDGPNFSGTFYFGEKTEDQIRHGL